MSRALSNLADTSRKWPTSALADKVMTEAEGAILEKITGPSIGAKIQLSKAAVKVVHVQSYTTATGIWSAKPNLASGTDYTTELRNADGVAELTNTSGVDYSAATWLVCYSRDEPEGTIGGQSMV